MVARHVLTVLMVAALLIAALPSRAIAASGQPAPSVQIELVVTLVTPELLSVNVDYTCLPSPFAFGGFVDVTVTQSSPLAASGIGEANLNCDGAGHVVQVLVPGGPAFSPGDALAAAQACTGLTCSNDARKVVIR